LATSDYLKSSKESYFEVPEVQDEEVETLVGDLCDVFDDV